MKRLKLAHKLMGLLLVGALVPILGIAWINIASRPVFAGRQVLQGLSGAVQRAGDQFDLEALRKAQEHKQLTVEQLETAVVGLETLKRELDDKRKHYDALERGIQALQNTSTLCLYGMLGFLAVLMVGGYTLLNHMQTPVREVVAKLANFQNQNESEASGDFLAATLEFDKFFFTARSILSETLAIASDLKRRLEPLTAMVAFSDENMSGFFTNVQEISRSSSYIANTLESTTASIEEVSTSAQTIADRSLKAAQESAAANEIATSGRAAVSETIETMESIKDAVLGLEDVIGDLNSASKQIGNIVNTITTIANQTNLLALNAAIEAARAGEQGRGFSVVADEVRKLAEESGEAAEEIGKLIKNMQQKTAQAVTTMKSGTDKVIEGATVVNVAGDNLTKIVAAVNRVNQMIQEISKASTEQSTNIESLTHSIESISGATKMTSEGTKRVASAVNEQLNYIRQYVSTTRELMTLVQLLSDMLGKFNI